MRSAGVGDEFANLGWVFMAGCGFYAADDIYAPGMEGGDGFGYIGGVEAAGDHDLTVFRVLEECGGGFVPVEGDAGAADGCCRAGIDEDGVGIGIGGEGCGLLGGIGAEVDDAEDAKCGAEFFS